MFINASVRWSGTAIGDFVLVAVPFVSIYSNEAGILGVVCWTARSLVLACVDTGSDCNEKASSELGKRCKTQE